VTNLYLPEHDDQWRDNLGNKGEFFKKDSVHFSPYRHYLQSRRWKAKRKKKLKKVGYRCESCGVVQQKGVTLDVHHLSYKRVTKERLSDLQVLCRGCHEKHHNH
jgi:5-methylcytosine-specific restriction endonuclease McrA